MGPALRLVTDEPCREAAATGPPGEPAAEAPAAAVTLEDAFRAHARYVACLGLRILGRADEVEDLVQDVFLEAQRRLAQIRHPGAVRAWLATVAVRMARRRLRRRRLRVVLRLDDAPDYLQVADASASPADRVLLARVYAALDRLPADRRLAWTLRHVEGEALERVALICGCSLATAKRRVAAAQADLEEALDG